jgi:hypothetical protein
MTVADGKTLDDTDHTAVTNNFLNSFFSQYSLALNGTAITQTRDLCQYRSYIETLLTFGRDVVSSHLTKAFLYLGNGDLLPCDPTMSKSKNKGFIEIWNRIKLSKGVQLLDRLHRDILNVIPYLFGA